jgi:hypothetical protein
MPEPLQPAPPRRLIRNAAWLVTWDEGAQSHVYRRDVDLTVEGDTVATIGPAETADHADAVEIDGRGFAVLPGFVDIHAHPSSEPMLKGLTDEVGSRQLYMSSLYEYLPLFNADPEGRRAATEVALCELMQSGVTTVCDLSAGSRYTIRSAVSSTPPASGRYGTCSSAVSSSCGTARRSPSIMLTPVPGLKWRSAARSKRCRASIGPGAAPPRSCRRPSRPGEPPPDLGSSLRMRRPGNPAVIAQLWTEAIVSTGDPFNL